MSALALGRWMLGVIPRHATFWLLAAALAALWPAAVVLGPLGLTLAEGGVAPVLYAIAFLASLAGGALGLSWALRLAPVLSRAAPSRRLAAEASLVATPSLVFVAVALVLPLVWAPGHGAARALLPRAALGELHLVALALAVARLPGGAALGGLALPFFGWVVPALVGAEQPFGATLCRALDLAQYWQPEPETVLTASVWKGPAGPIIGLLAGAWLATSAGQAHALRDPG